MDIFQSKILELIAKAVLPLYNSFLKLGNASGIFILPDQTGMWDFFKIFFTSYETEQVNYQLNYSQR